jgi:hypothetical protein
MDLLVMENLFHNHEISKTYDLKGIGMSPQTLMIGLIKQKVERLRNRLLHPLGLPKRKLPDPQRSGMGTGSKPYLIGQS